MILGRLKRIGLEHVWTFPNATMPSWAGTEPEKNTVLIGTVCLSGSALSGIWTIWYMSVSSLAAKKGA